MSITLVGVNHETAPISIREKMAIRASQFEDALALLGRYVPKSIILSTCNRTEIYSIDSGGNDAEKASLAFLTAQSNIPNEDLLQYVHVSWGREAIEHLFRVAGGMESTIVGEFEILGQVSQALEVAEKSEMVNLPLRRAFHGAIRAGRRIRKETGISRNAVSIGSVAVDLATSIVGGLARCKMVVIGTGQAGTLVAEVARKRGVSQMVIAGRTTKRVEEMAGALQCTPVNYASLAGELISTDIVVTCSGAPHQVLDFAMVKDAMKERPGVPMVIIDIAVPRNVEPEVGKIKNVFIYNMDDLNEISRLNNKQRAAEIRRAEEIMAGEVDKFWHWWHDFETRPVVIALMSKADEIRSVQLNRILKKLPPLSDEQRSRLEAMTKSVVNRLLKDPIRFLNSNGNGNRGDIVREIFQLDREDDERNQSA
jgi:glutamyl-tRNA reductase